MTTVEKIIVGMIVAIVVAISVTFAIDGPRTETSGPKQKTEEKDPKWETLASPDNTWRYAPRRAKTPTGWIVQTKDSLVFVPDPNHEWLK